MFDKYSTFSELAASEPQESYHLVVQDRRSAIVVAAPHAGGIEPGTSEISMGIAGDDWSLYLFEGLKPEGNGALHLTSSNFDEPQCLKLLKQSEIVVTIHGEQSEGETVFLGGLHIGLRAALRIALEQVGFAVEQHENPAMQGLSEGNICNIGRSGGGVQLELSKGLRRTLFASLSRRGRQQPTPRFGEFCRAVRAGIETKDKNL